MPRVTSKFQFTLPKAVAEASGVRVGDDLDCESAGSVIVLRPRTGHAGVAPTVSERLALFDAATAALATRTPSALMPAGGDRGWTRGDAYERGTGDDLAR
jgi:antitoxin component of MazEF toxin-antitoxin module